MTRALMAMILAVGVTTFGIPRVHAAQQPNTGSASESQPSPSYDADAGRQLLDMANRERAQAGLPPLQMDEGLAKAAQAHAAAMAAQQKLSHQLSGEPNLVHRLAASSKTHLDESGENVAFAGTLEQAHQSLMHSPPHRANLLNAEYNVAGFSVVRSGSLLYVAQDFGHSLPSYSTREADYIVAGRVDDIRSRSRLPALHLVKGSEAAGDACSMARKDSLHTTAPRSRRVLRYTTVQPQVLPGEASHVIESRSLSAYAVGSCYARTATYPSGAYWITLLFY